MKLTKNSIKSLVDELDYNTDYFQIRNQSMNAYTEVIPHTHKWGQLNIINAGVMEVEFEQYPKLVAPWQYVIWIPASILHSSYNKRSFDYCSITVPLSYSSKMPSEPCMFELSEIARAIVNDLIKRQLTVLTDESDQELAQVLIKQLVCKNPTDTYLPMINDDKFLRPILEALLDNPADSRTLKEWSELVYTSEKTLARRFQRELNMTFREWRIRLRFLQAVHLLKSAISIQEIAYQLGYSSTSSFILMFSKIAGTTPEKYRKLNSFY